MRGRGLRRTAAAALVLVLLPAAARALTVRVSAAAGSRGVGDARIVSVYGKGWAWSAGAEVVVWKGLSVGAAFEGSPAQDGVLGIYESKSVFQLWGLDLAAGWEWRVRAFAVFLRTGLGLYHYRQDVNYAYVQDYPVSRTPLTVIAAGGFKIFVWKGLFLQGLAKFVPLKVHPYDQDVDLGGWRFAGGLGFEFGR